jgi:outer membrane protein
MPSHTNPSLPFLWILVLAALIGISFVLYQHQPARIAYVDSGKLFTEYEAMTAARREYANQQQEWQRNIDTLQSEFKRGVQLYQRNRSTLTAGQRQERETSLRRQQEQLMSYQQAVRQENPVAQQRITQPIVDSTNVFIKKYGQQQGYDLILLTAEGDNIAYGAPGFDITVPVLKELNAHYQQMRKSK